MREILNLVIVQILIPVTDVTDAGPVTNIVHVHILILVTNVVHIYILVHVKECSSCLHTDLYIYIIHM